MILGTDNCPSLPFSNMEKLYELYLKHPQICTDTRNIIPDCLFVCLKGERFDGNTFALSALEQGAAYVITENTDLSDNPRCVVVADSLKTLQELAAYHRQQLTIPVIGITGTNGKTTTKELVSSVLSKKFRTAYTKGNLNNHIGVPLTLLSIRPDDEIAIVEMGANHLGEIEFLCNIARPGFGLITNVGKAHIEGFGSEAEIVHTKKALYRSVIRDHGTLFVNVNDSKLRDGLDYDKIVYYAEGGEDNIVDMSPYLRIRVAGCEVDTHLTGSYNIYNFLAAAAVGHYFGVPDKQTAEALSEYTPSNHRSQINKIGSNVIISDYYNANPTSMEAALRNLAKLHHPHKLAILGDMGELGVVSHDEHLKIIQLCESLGLDALFVGSEFAFHHPKRCYHDVEELNQILKEQPITDSMILVKGSNYMHLNKLTELLG